MTSQIQPPTRPEGHQELGSGRRSAVPRRLALVAVAAAAVALAACGSSSSASTTSSTNASRSGNGTGGSAAGGGGAPRFPGVTGTIAAINGMSLEVQNPATGQTTVTYTTATTFQQTVVSSVVGVTAGSCITATGTPPTGSGSTNRFGGPVTATRVAISQPTSGSCTAGLGGFRAGGTGGPPGGGPGTGASGGAPPGSQPGGSPSRTFRGQNPGQFAVASGMVTAVTGSQVTVSETNPSTQAASTAVVTLTPSTTFTERTSASPADLAVGKCAQAVGSADTTGAVAARSITVSTPGASGCAGRLGRFGGGGGAGGGGGGGSSSA